MADTLFIVLWYLIHSVVFLLEKSYNLAVKFVNFVVVYVFYKSRILNNNFQYEHEFVEHNVNRLTKVPEHLVIVLGVSEVPNIDSLSKLILWSWSAGIQFISFFDNKGILKKDHKKLYAEVEKRRDQTINVIWPDSVYKQQHQTGDSSKGLNVSAHTHSKQHSIAVNFFCESDGKASIGALCQQLGYGLQNGLIRSSDDITIDIIDQKLNENMNKLPDPEVAIYFGNVCSTYGLLPWQIRLTEFISIKSQNSLRLKHFLNVLFVYAKCEQRLGK